MPTKLPRITITIQPATKALIDELTKVSGRPGSTFVAEMLDEAAEAIFGPMIEAIKLANEKKTEAWDVLNSSLHKAQLNTAQLSLAIDEEKKKAKGEKQSGRP